jgi:hydroxymethylpyrimidine pyrophosphatase-like HAD family hydrolase/fructoselysine-6-P-deglycase FrlB-like protein
MSFRYENQIQMLKDTYKWALDTNIDELKKSIELSLDSPLIAIGSGGSLTIASLAALLHVDFTGHIASYMTPFEFVSRKNTVQKTAIFIFSAGGRNSDILSTFEEAVCREPYQLTIVCGRKNSPLSRLALKYSYVRFIELEHLPFKKDGYISTNSLLAFSTLLVRAYLSLCEDNAMNLPATLGDLVCNGKTINKYLEELHEKLRPVLKKETLVTLYGNWSQPAGMDLESKFTEVALGNIRGSDYRNFGHGRHFWLARHHNNSGVLVFVDEETKGISERTLGLIPSSIPALQFSVNYAGPVSSLAHLCNVLYIVKIAGDLKGIDPGRPGVPQFGRRLYNVRIRRNEMVMYKQVSKFRDNRIIAISRKCPEAFMNNELLDLWKEAYMNFIENLEKTRFRAVVFDYDGTFCEPEKRFQGPSRNIIDELIRILNAGIGIGIATGRGKSVRNDLQRGIPQELWDNVLIGYYNSSDIAMLSENERPIRDGDFHPVIESIDNLLTDSWLSKVCKVESRPNQIGISEVKIPFTIGKVRDILIHLIENSNIQVLESTHSLDILAPNVSKCLLVDTIRQQYGCEVLCIGDKGKYPGNDYELLQQPYSLSVFEVSPDPNTCWNIVDPGYRYAQATLEYLKSLREEDGCFCFRRTKKEVTK